MLSTETALDLRYNIAALTIAICAEEFMLPEKAFSIISDSNYKSSSEDVEDMIKMRNQGLTYKAIAEIYDLTDSTIFKKIKYYKVKKKKSSQTAI